MRDLDAVVIGGGVIGLAVARSLARQGREVVVLEAEAELGTHGSARNSEVIHAGLYYPTGSLKARLCVAGKRALYEYCAERGVAHRRLGKLIVATREEELEALDRIRLQAAANGVADLVELGPNEIAAREPAVRAVRALFSPSTGILDSHAYLAALRADLEQRGGHVVTSTPFLGGAIETTGFELEIGGSEPVRTRCATLVNAAGLWAPSVARCLRGFPEAHAPEAHYARGQYFTLRGASPFSHLVYPVPVSGALGIHVTLDLQGQARFGPDIAWVDRVDYRFDETRADAFYRAIRRYYPALEDGALAPGYAGIRPKLGPAGSPSSDFVIQGPSDHDVPGLVNLYGIESPGLTASLDRRSGRGGAERSVAWALAQLAFSASRRRSSLPCSSITRYGRPGPS